MKQNVILAGLVLLLLGTATSCGNMLTAESDRYLSQEKNTLSSPNDSVYSIIGILTKLQTVGDRYVVLGELRADLMDVTDNADAELRELNNAKDISADNSWLDVNDYYIIINHCNYLIKTIDTSVVVSGTYPLRREWAAAKAIRAWTYMQLAFNFGFAYYLEDPILTVEDAHMDFTEKRMNREAVLAALEQDLLEVVDVEAPDYGGVSDYKTEMLLPSVSYLLGEIYLWQNNYERAAYMYHKCILDGELTVSPVYSTTVYKYDNRYSAWSNFSMLYSMAGGSNNEASMFIPYFRTTTMSASYYNQSMLYSLCYVGYKVAPSQRCLDLYSSQIYQDLTYDLINEPVIYSGDLRGEEGSYITKAYDYESGYSSVESSSLEDANKWADAPIGSARIYIYNSYESKVYVQRNSLAYLRYAEAVNRLGKPTLALAVLDYGLAHTNLTDSTKVNQSEMEWGDTTFTATREWLDWNYGFSSTETNVGTRQRGQGPSAQVEFPLEMESLQDSIDYVEEVLLEECALETSFNGNRYQDLMRFTLHRPEANYIGKAIGKKFEDRYQEYVDYFADETNWYLPYVEE